MIAVLALSLLVGRGSDEYDARQDLEKQIPYLKLHAPHVLWQAVAETQSGVSEICASADRIFITPTANQKPGNVVAYDRATGHKLWDTPVSPSATLMNVTCTVVGADVVIDTGVGRLIEGATGKVTTAPSGASPALSFFASVQQKKMHVYIRPPMAPRGLYQDFDWPLAKPLVDWLDPTSKYPTRMGMTAEEGFVIGGPAMSFNSAGHVRYRIEGPFRLVDNLGPSRIGDDWIVFVAANPEAKPALDEPRKIVAIGPDGHVRWERPYKGHAPKTTLVGAKTFGYIDGSHIATMSLTDGKPGWSAVDETEAIMSAPFFDADRVYYTTRSQAVMLDSKSGKQLSRRALPASFGKERLSDGLVLRDKHAIWIGEEGVAVFDAKKGTPLWSIDVRGTHSSTFAAAAAGYAASRARSGAQIEPLKNVVVGLGRDAALALDDPNHHLHGEIAVGAGAVMMEAGIVEMLAAGVAMQAAVAHAKFVSELIQWQNLASYRLDHAHRLFANSVQGHYYVRPLEWLWGAGVFVLDLDTGKWAEIVTGPTHTFTAHEREHNPDVILAADGASVITVGLSEDPRWWVSDERVPDYHGVWEMPMALGVPPLRALSDYPAQSLVPAGTTEVMEINRFW